MWPHNCINGHLMFWKEYHELNAQDIYVAKYGTPYSKLQIFKQVTKYCSVGKMSKIKCKICINNKTH